MNDRSSRASVTLVALCFLAVLGIALASYLAISNQAVKLSNRSSQITVSTQLAEMGLEEALRAFNKNDFSDWTSGTAPNQTAVDWTISGTTATATIAFPTTKYGTSGVTGSVKVRVDNYNAFNLSSTWSASTSYRINDLVGYSGIWYRSVRNSNSGNTPSDTGPFLWWVPAPISWAWNKDLSSSLNRSDSAYSVYDLVNYNGVWYRCVSAAPVATTASIPSLAQEWSSSSVNYTYGDIVVYTDGVAYRCFNPHTSSASILPTNTSYWSTTIYWLPVVSSQPWAASTYYSATNGDVVNYSGSQYRCITSHTSVSSFDASKWSLQITPFSLSWSSSTYYSRGSIAFLNGTWYYCRVAGTGASDPSADTSKWVSLLSPSGSQPTGSTSSPPPAPVGSDPIGSTRYSVGDYIYRSTTWYRCTVSHLTPSSGTWNASYWVSTVRPSIEWAWRTSFAYSFNDLTYFSYWNGGTWYRAKAPNPGWYPDPAQTDYWEKALDGSWNWDSSVTYNLSDVVSRNGVFYRCIRTHANQGPPNATYWSTDPLLSLNWNADRAYSQNSTAYYNGNWYLSRQDNNAGQNPANNKSWWAVAPRTISAWDSTKDYNVDDLVSFSSTWYRCIKNPTTNQATSDATYWIEMFGSTYQWNSTTSYTTTSYVNYDGVWYRCISNNTGKSPNNSTYWTAIGAPVVYAEGTATLPDSSAPIKTQLRATIATASLFPNAAAATTTLTLSSAGTVDSYDQTVSDYSSPGGYSAVLAAGAASGTALTVTGAATVQGYAAAPSSSTSPYAPRVAFGTNTILGGATSPASPKADLTHVSRSPYIPQFDINIQAHDTMTNLPSASVSVTANLGTPGATTPSIYYYSGNLTLAAQININGPAILYIDGNFRVNPSGMINITSNGSATIYCTGRFRVESTSSGIRNLTNDPKKLFILSDTSSSQTQYYAYANSSSFPFCAVIYLPNTTATKGFDIQNSPQFYGAVSASEVTFTNNANLHYDTSLRYATFMGVDQPCIISEWRELNDPTEQATMP